MNSAAATREELIADVDLALAALRRVIVRAIDGIAPAPQPIGQPAKMVWPPRGSAMRAAREIPASLQRVSAAGLEIEIAAGGGAVTFRGISARVSRRQAQLAGVLAKASPNFIARDEAPARAWPDLAVSSRGVTIAEAMRCLAGALAPLKIKVEAMPGYGLRLWAMEDGK